MKRAVAFLASVLVGLGWFALPADAGTGPCSDNGGIASVHASPDYPNSDWIEVRVNCNDGTHVFI